MDFECSEFLVWMLPKHIAIFLCLNICSVICTSGSIGDLSAKMHQLLASCTGAGGNGVHHHHTIPLLFPQCIYVEVQVQGGQHQLPLWSGNEPFPQLSLTVTLNWEKQKKKKLKALQYLL